MLFVAADFTVSPQRVGDPQNGNEECKIVGVNIDIDIAGLRPLKIHGCTNFLQILRVSDP